jgi:hypothetical protein
MAKFDQRAKARFAKRQAEQRMPPKNNRAHVKVEGPVKVEGSAKAEHFSARVFDEEMGWVSFDVPFGADGKTFVGAMEEMKKSANAAAKAFFNVSESVSRVGKSWNDTMDAMAKEQGITRAEFLNDLMRKMEEQTAKEQTNKTEFEYEYDPYPDLEEQCRNYFNLLVEDRATMKEEYEWVEVDNVILPPDTDTRQDGIFVVYLDDGIIPQVMEVEGRKASDGGKQVGFITHGSEYEFDIWATVDYLFGDDLDPVSVVRDNGIDYEILAYRRATENQQPYQDGWIGPDMSIIPEDMREDQPADRIQYRRPGTRVISDASRVGREGYMAVRNRWNGKDIVTANDVILAFKELNERDFVHAVERSRPVTAVSKEWVTALIDVLIENAFLGRPIDNTGRVEAEIAAHKANLFDMFNNFGDEGPYV